LLVNSRLVPGGGALSNAGVSTASSSACHNRNIILYGEYWNINCGYTAFVCERCALRASPVRLPLSYPTPRPV
jgi:hypothetical protein